MTHTRETTQITLTATTKTYTLQEASKIVKQQQCLPYDEQSKWHDSKTGCRVYFINNK